jgi:hypothetical protein
MAQSFATMALTMLLHLQIILQYYTINFMIEFQQEKESKSLYNFLNPVPQYILKLQI